MGLFPSPPENRREWRSNECIQVLLGASLAGFLGPITATIYFPVLPSIQEDFDASLTKVFATVSVYLAISAVVPLLWGPLSDKIGRRGVIIFVTMGYVIASVACGLSESIDMLIGFRLLQAFFSGAHLTVGAGAVSDVYPPRLRARALSKFLLGPLVGPIIGPAIGGSLAGSFGWRSIFWCVAGAGLLVGIYLLFFFPESMSEKSNRYFIEYTDDKKSTTDGETNEKELTQLEKKKINNVDNNDNNNNNENNNDNNDENDDKLKNPDVTNTGVNIASKVNNDNNNNNNTNNNNNNIDTIGNTTALSHHVKTTPTSNIEKIKDIAYAIRPWHTFRFLKIPGILVVTILTDIAYGGLMGIMVLMPIVYSEHFKLSTEVSGVLVACTGLGSLSGTVLGGIFADKMIKGHDKKCVYRRLYITLTGSIIYTPVLIGFAWLHKTHPAVTVIFSIGVGFNFCLPRPGLTSYSIETARQYFGSSAASSVSGIIYATMFGTGAIVAQIAAIAFEAIGAEWYLTIVALIELLVTVCAAIIVYKERERYMTQKKAKEMEE